MSEAPMPGYPPRLDMRVLYTLALAVLDAGGAPAQVMISPPIPQEGELPPSTPPVMLGIADPPDELVAALRVWIEQELGKLPPPEPETVDV